MAATYHGDFMYGGYIFGGYTHICTKYEVSMFKPMARRVVDRLFMTPTQDDNLADDTNYTQRTKHDGPSSYGIMPNVTVCSHK